jgi:hypothetical protein
MMGRDFDLSSSAKYNNQQIHQQKFLDLKSVKKLSVKMAIQDIEDKKFWKCLYVLLPSFLQCQQTGDGQDFLPFPQDNASY